LGCVVPQVSRAFSIGERLFIRGKRFAVLCKRQIFCRLICSFLSRLRDFRGFPRRRNSFSRPSALRF
jgi:hypothetical protein